MAIDSSHVVLDFGTGTGALSQIVARSGSVGRLVSIDPDARALRIATRTAVAPQPGFVRATGGELPFRDATFDRAISRLVFHHLGQQGSRDALAEIYRVLRPHGRLGILDWGRPQGRARQATFMTVRLLDGLEATRPAATGQLPQLIAASGFSEVETVASWNGWAGTMALYCARRPFRTPWLASRAAGSRARRDR